MNAALALLAVIGCASSPNEIEGGGDSNIEVSFEDISVAPGEEKYTCQSVNLNNDEPLYVNIVTSDSGSGWHHSNWFYAPEDKFAGPDGSWKCADRGFDAVSAGIAGGPIFAQSTQSTGEAQVLPSNTAIRIPARHQIIGTVHMFNASDEPVSSAMKLTLGTIQRDEETKVVEPIVLTHTALALPKNKTSQFTMNCLATDQIGGTFDWPIHYVLPHYHQLGTSLSVRAIGGARDGEEIFSIEGAVGEPHGKTLTPPFQNLGMEGFSVSCNYLSPGNSSVGYGPGASDEMCVFFAFSEAPFSLAGDVFSGPGTITESDATYESRTSSCDRLIAL